ncbi:unnamed protein product [Vitrella brassicaformis CCMP3155]|uniref:Uncharacterized protein n=1 Tax=Vitrella brassicaformis (strain CCMP3155) TaxID=1169540 RepID=A0A0G4F862_VITBC|nr:unnamed protein product [Vitrella brassicaformis CCMP3155]|eukprot:CEM08903.1 unnamed protein product [Vitrella brassicaformis CCMP3155]
MDVNQVLTNAQAVLDSLLYQQTIQDEIIECLSHLLDEDPASIAAQVSSPAAWLLHYQLGPMALQSDAVTTQLEQWAASLTSAVDALTSTTEAAAALGSTHTEAQVAVGPGPSYRLIHRSGNPPADEDLARRRLSRDELANIFGHLHPWELTPLWRRLGTPLFYQSAANYTQVVMDCEDDTARRMWETMPLAVAHKWGKRSTNIREIRIRCPEYTDDIVVAPDTQWCRGTWTSLIEGHAIGRAAIAAKKRIERAGGEGAAAASDDDGHGQLADGGTLEKLSFEVVQLDDSVATPDPLPSSDLPPAPTAPIHLPALTTIDSIPSDDCLSARVGRQWHTRAVKTLTIRGSIGEEEVGGARSWLADCVGVEVLDINAWIEGVPAGMLSALPADGQSLSALHTLRCLTVKYDRPADVDRLREMMVARGASRSIRQLKIDVGVFLSNTDENWERLQKAAQLVDAVAQPDAFIACDSGRHGVIAVELLSRRGSGTRTMQGIMDEFTKTAGKVSYSGHDEAHPVAITDDTFPAAHTLQLRQHALVNEAKKKRAVEIASNMPSLSCIETEDALFVEVLDFLELLQTALVSQGRGRTLTLRMHLPAAALIAPLQNLESPCLWGRGGSNALPAIQNFRILIDGDVDDGDADTFYKHVMATVTSFNDELEGHQRTTVERLNTQFQQRFLAEQASLNLSGGPYKLSLNTRNGSMCVERRDASTRDSA